MNKQVTERINKFKSLNFKLNKDFAEAMNWTETRASNVLQGKGMRFSCEDLKNLHELGADLNYIFGDANFDAAREPEQVYVNNWKDKYIECLEYNQKLTDKIISLTDNQ